MWSSTYGEALADVQLDQQYLRLQSQHVSLLPDLNAVGVIQIRINPALITQNYGSRVSAVIENGITS